MFYQGTVLLQRGEDEAGGNIIQFCAPVKSPGATEPIFHGYQE